MEEGDASYFTSYEELQVHELMLKDEPRTRAYQMYIENHPEIFKDKVVIDVGAGTGILSLFAAKAGAKKVYAIEASRLSHLCKEIVAINGYDDIIEVVHCRAEEANLPIDPNSADVLISEWMGFYLLHEAMLSSVIYVKDKWLKQGGVMLPSTATIFMCPVSLSSYVQENLTCWDNTYGFNFQPLKKRIIERNLRQPIIENIEQSNCIANPEQVTHLHLNYVSSEDLVKIRRNLSFKLSKYAICHGFAFWFDCHFEVDEDDEKKVVLSTAPGGLPTHWKQTIILLPDALMVSKDDTLCVNLELEQDRDNARRYNISLAIDDTSSDDDDDNGDEDVEDLVDNVEDNEIRGMILDVLSHKT